MSGDAAVLVEARELQHRLLHLAERGRPGVARFGEGMDAIRRGLTALERRTRGWCSNLSVTVPFPFDNDQLDLERRARVKKVDGWTVTTARGLRENPLAPAVENIRIGPVAFQSMVIDHTTGLFAGPYSATGYPTGWMTTDSHLVRQLVALHERTFDASQPAVVPPHVGERQLRVVQLLAKGLADSAIARVLGVSVRTVSADVATLAAVLDVSGRTEIIARLSRRL